MLSLVLIVIIVSNVVLWSYQMNQLDLDRMHENVTLANVTRETRSPWFTAQSEYAVATGSRTSGTYTDTKAIDGFYENFTEETTSDIYRLDINNSFAIDSVAYPRNCIRGLEIAIRYNVSDSSEKWFLKAYNWNLSSFGNTGFNDTGGNQPLLGEWNDYAINVTDNWTNYVDSNGTLLLEFLDEGVSTNQTVAQVDFFSVRATIDGAAFDLRNSSPMTTHIVAVWIANSTNHQRYEANLFINSGEATLYLRADISLPHDRFIAKVVTERGNVAVFP